MFDPKIVATRMNKSFVHLEWSKLNACKLSHNEIKKNSSHPVVGKRGSKAESQVFNHHFLPNY